MVKAIAFIFLFVISLLILSHCKKDNSTPRSYPRLRNTIVSDVTEKGARFTADLYSVGTEKIIEYGFVWGAFDPNIRFSDRVLLGSCDTPGVYSAYISSSLIKDRKYIVKPYVQTADHVVYGLPMSFISLGSSAPFIYSFYPQTAEWLDTITIKGKNISHVASENIVKLNQTICETIGSTDTTLRIVVNTALKDLRSLLSVELAGNITVLTSDTFRLIPPVITDFNPKLAEWGDTLLVTGMRLKTLTLNKSNYVKLGTFLCSILRVYNDSSVAVSIPYEINTINSNLSILINGLTIQGSQTFQLKAPEFSFSPKDGTWNDIITLTGKFNTIASRNSVSFNGVNGTIKSATAKEIKVQVPIALSSIKTKIIYSAVPFTIATVDSFRLRGPVLKTFSPLSGPGGTVVTIKGKYFSVGNSTVLFGNTPGVISTMNDSTIYAKVPTAVIGPVKISVKAKLQTIISSEDFNITNPKIISVYPLSGTFNDEVTITGENLIPATGSTTISFSGIQATVKSSTSTSIVVSVPLTMDSIPRTITVNAGSNTVSSVEKFMLTPFQIISISPGSADPAQDIIIAGLNFNPVPASNIVSWDIYSLKVKSSTPTEIIVTLPDFLPRGKNKIQVTVGGYKRLSPQYWTINSQWLRIPAPYMSTNGLDRTRYTGMTIYGEAPGNFGYLCSPASNVMYKFDPSDKTFTKLNTTTPFYLTAQMGEVVCRDTFYLIAGHDYYPYDGTGGMFALNETSNKLRKINTPFDGRTGVAFSLNNKIYYGLDYWTSTKTDMWECDPGIGYTWTRKSNIPVASIKTYSSYFSVADKGYVLFSDNTFWQYDPVSDVWTKKPASLVRHAR